MIGRKQKNSGAELLDDVQDVRFAGGGSRRFVKIGHVIDVRLEARVVVLPHGSYRAFQFVSLL